MQIKISMCAAISNGNQSEEVADELSSKIAEKSEQSFVPIVEDVSEWLTKVFRRNVTPDSLLNELDNGVLVCELAEKIQKGSESFCKSHSKRTSTKTKASLNPLPKLGFKCHKSATKESFFARENAANFLRWCSQIGIQESTLFESEGLVLHKQLKHVVLTLLELGRLAAKYGFDPLPGIVNLEREIDREEEEKRPKLSQVKGSKPKDKIDEKVRIIL